MKHVGRRLTSVVSFFLVLFLMGLSWYGMRLPYQYPIVEVGDYTLAAFDSGLALYQHERMGPFHRISPLNDFVVDESGARRVHLEAEEFSGDEYESWIATSHLHKLIMTMQGYWGLAQPRYDLSMSDEKLRYTVSQDAGRVIIEKELRSESLSKIHQNGMTISFEPGDLVFDRDSHQILVGSVNSKLLSQVKQMYGLQLYTDGTLRTSWKRLGLISPSFPGGIVVEAQENQQMIVNQEGLLIEVVEQKSSDEVPLRMSMKIRSLKDDK